MQRGGEREADSAGGVCVRVRGRDCHEERAVGLGFPFGVGLELRLGLGDDWGGRSGGSV